MPTRPALVPQFSSLLRLVPMALVATVGLILFFVPVAAAGAATLSGTVSGQAPGQEAKGLPKVFVTVSDSATGEKVGSVTTEAGGKYTLEIPTGVFEVKFDPGPESQFVPATVHKVEIGGSRTLNVTLAIAGLVHLTGTLRDAQGDPVPAAHIGLYDQKNNVPVELSTEADGSFDLAAPAGNYQLYAYGNNKAVSSLPESWQFIVPSFELGSDQTLELSLPPTSKLVIEASGAAGAPIANARVRIPSLNQSADLGGVQAEFLESRGDDGTGSGSQQGYTDQNGIVAFTVFRGANSNGSPPADIFPPAGSGYGHTTFGLPVVEGDTTVSVSLQDVSEEDTEAPNLDELTIEPAEVDTGGESRTVTVRGHITDDLSGFKSGEVIFVSPSGEHFAKGFEFGRTGGDANNGTYKTPVSFEAFGESGIWQISAIRLTDGAGNERVLGAEQLEELGLPHSVLVKGKEEAEEDHEGPKIDELAIEPSSIDTSASGQTVILVAHMTDNLSGFKEGLFDFKSPSGKQKIVGVAAKPTSGDALNGSYEIPLNFKQFSEGGSWQLTDIRLEDQAGKARSYMQGQIEELGFPRTINVESEGDTEAPVLHSLKIEPSEIDTSSGSQAVVVTAVITDDLSGFDWGTLKFFSPSGIHGVSTTEFVRVAGNANEGVYQQTVTFPQGSEPGDWNISSIDLNDRIGNGRFLQAEAIAAAGFPHTVAVLGAKEDTEAPKLDELGIEPESIDTTAEGRTVSVFAHVTDDFSGLKEARVAFVSPSGKVSYQGSATEPTKGTATSGDYKIPVSFEQASEGGTWRISSIWLADHAGHERELSAKEIEEMGWPHKVFVKGKTDNEPPQLQSLKIEPTEIDVSTVKQQVFVTAAISDSPAGFKDGSVAFVSPGEGQTVFGSFQRIAGNEFEGTYRAVSVFPQGSEPGAWNIAWVRLLDREGNEVEIPLGELEGAGLPHTVKVVTQPPVVTSIEPFSGPEAGGTEVLISGSGFTGAKEVHFGSAPASEFFVKSPTLIRAVSPPGSGTVDVTVSTPAGSSEISPADRFAYNAQVTLASSPNPSVRGQKVTFTATVPPGPEGSPAPLGTVTFSEGSTTLGVVNLKKGSASLSATTLGAGKHPILATYSGDANHPEASSAPLTQNVEKASTQLLLASGLNPTPYGSNATLKATVNALAPGVGTPAGTVTFREGETVLDTVQLNGHNASLSLKALPPGEHVISASYSGDPNNLPSAGEPLVQTIVKATTETSLTSSLDPAPFGSSASLKATVDSVAPSVLTPTGTVTFREGETVLAIVPLTTGGVAKFPLKTVAPGSYAITATYDGGEGFEGSEATLTQTIVKASTELTLTSSKNPAPKGSTGTLKATVKAIAPGTGTPAGTVTLREGETVLATIPLSGNSVTYPLKSLAVGTHNITAVYSGNANYGKSEDAISQAITP